jgi:hypothetical protein
MHISSLAQRFAFVVGAAALFTTSLVAAENPFLGRWALKIPDGSAGWLGIVETNGQLKGSLLWGGGSVLPVASTKVEGDTLIVTRVNESRQRDADGKTVIKKSTETITAKLDGDNMKLTTSTVGDDGKVRGRPADFTGKRIAAVPPAPDLAKLKFGEAISLLNGKDLSGWKTMGNNPSAWKVEDGILRNDAVQEPGKAQVLREPSAPSASSRTSTSRSNFACPPMATAACICAAFMKFRWPTRSAEGTTRTIAARSTAASCRVRTSRNRRANGRPSTSRSWTAT